MVIIGIDAHKRSHTVVVVDEQGRQLARKTTGTTTDEHLALLMWAAQHGSDRLWAVEDCRHLTRRLERDLLAAGERIIRVPPKLMAHMRDSARTSGKSDPIDALAVARAALRESDLPVARLDGRDREVRLLIDHREDLVAERTRMISRLRWHLHELDPDLESAARSLNHVRNLDKLAARLEGAEGTVARLARDITERCGQLTVEIKELEKELTTLVQELAPSLVAICGCGPLTAAKILGETAGIQRFKSRDAYARHNGTAPLPVWSSNHARHRLSRTGNRQLNAAIHRIALTQARWHPDAQAMIARRRAQGDGRPPRPQTTPLRCRLQSAHSRRRSRTTPRRLTEEPHYPSPLDRGARDSFQTFPSLSESSSLSCEAPRSSFSQASGLPKTGCAALHPKNHGRQQDEQRERDGEVSDWNSSYAALAGTSLYFLQQAIELTGAFSNPQVRIELGRLRRLCSVLTA